MFLISVENEAALESLAEDLDAIGEFDHVDLAELNSLSIMEATNNVALDWLSHEPVVFSEEQGIVIAGFSIDGVIWLRDFGDGAVQFGANPKAIAEFASRCKDGHVYCLDTF